MRRLLLGLVVIALLLTSGCQYWHDGQFGGRGGGDTEDQQ